MALLAILVVLLHFFFFDRMPEIDVLFIAPAIIILSINYYLNRQFYPALLAYQSESEVAFYIKKQNLPSDQLIFLEEDQWITAFYLKRNVPMFPLQEVENIELSGKLVYTNKSGLEKLKESGISYHRLNTFPDFHVTTLNGTFINKKTRPETIQSKYLVEIKE